MNPKLTALELTALWCCMRIFIINVVVRNGLLRPFVSIDWRWNEQIENRSKQKPSCSRSEYENSGANNGNYRHHAHTVCDDVPRRRNTSDHREQRTTSVAEMLAPAPSNDTGGESADGKRINNKRNDGKDAPTGRGHQRVTLLSFR